jgi:hypothetical protein
MKKLPRLSVWVSSLMMFALLFSADSPAYSVFTHEELIDLAWNDSIRPILLARFPGATEEQLRVAHSYAYGGCAIQDMGYYPFGKEFFSTLTHYVRTGDFVSWMLQNARTIDELAFAIGALSHYLGDSIGHAEAVNPATGVAFPKLQKKFGPSITYTESPHAHIRTEFAFDVGELTNFEFAPPEYLEYIGFRVPGAFLERAFAATYGFNIHDVVGRARPALRSYRSAVRSFLPLFAKAEVVLHRRHFPPQVDSPAYRQFVEDVAHTNYDRMWKHAHRGPGFRAHLVAILVFLVPKIGAASDLAIKIPTQETQESYLQSVNHTVDEFRGALRDLTPNTNTARALANLDLDTGTDTQRGEYDLADSAHAQLLNRLTSKPDRVIPVELQRELLKFYADPAQGSEPSLRVQEQLKIISNMRVN